MNRPSTNPKLDLIFERTVDVPPEKIWKGWTDPKFLMQWFCPRPWKVVECDIDLRPGGTFRTVMQSPEGQNMPEGVGTYIEVVENRKLIWTSALLPGYRPAPQPKEGFTFTVYLLLEPQGKGTKYTAIAMHATEESRKVHEDMGFQQGWGLALDQLVELSKTM